jgi:hypothetical protein
MIRKLGETGMRRYIPDTKPGTKAHYYSKEEKKKS